jgi:hypothetical protein
MSADNRPRSLVRLGVYRHHKGGLYRVVEILPDATGDSQDWTVIYESLKPRIVVVNAFASPRQTQKVYDRWTRSAEEFGSSLGPIEARYDRFLFIAETEREALVLLADKYLKTEVRDYSDCDGH